MFWKKLFASVVAGAMVISLMACTPGNAEELIEQGEEFELPEDAVFLTENEWAYYDPNIGEAETLLFSKEGEYYYNCECGEPIGASDMYDVWEYDAKTQSITVKSLSDEEMEDQIIQILKSEEYRLVLKMDGKVKAFEAYNNWYYSPEIHYECTEYFEGYSARLSFTGIEGNTITVAPYYYDGDVSEHREMQSEEILAEGAKFYELHVDTISKEGEEKSTFEYTELTAEDVQLMIESGGGNGYVWYNEDLEIEKILFYGELIVYE